MKDADFKQQKARIQRLIARWVKTVGLGWWKVHFDYWDDPSKFHAEDNGHVATRALATTTADWRYMEATISFNMLAVEEMDDDDLEYAFVHELCHVLIHEMRADHEGERVHEHVDHEERVCTTLAHALLWTREAGVKDR